MKETILKIVRAFVALLHVESTDTDTIAQLKGQIADLTSQLQSAKKDAFTDDEVAEINAAANMVAAATPPTVSDTQATATVTPAPDQSANSLPASVTEAAPADVAQAAAAAPAAAS